jgi:hypothetical protein
MKKRNEWDMITRVAKEAGRVYVCITYYTSDDDFQVHFGDMVMDSEGGHRFEAQGGKLAKTLKFAMYEAARRHLIHLQNVKAKMEEIFKRSREEYENEINKK